MTPEAMKEVFKERKVLSKIVLLMVASFFGVGLLAYMDYAEGNEQFLPAALTMLSALEGGILIGYLSVRSALIDKPKTPKS